MQNLELAVLLAITAAAVIAVALRIRSGRPVRQSLLAAVLGVAAGTLGAIAIVVLRLDIVPDAQEGIVIPLVAAGITLGLLAAGWRRRQNG